MPDKRQGILIPVNASELEILLLRYQYPDKLIETSGLIPRLTAAEEKWDERIGQAYALLKPYGVSLQSIFEVVVKAIQSQ